MVDLFASNLLKSTPETRRKIYIPCFPMHLMPQNLFNGRSTHPFLWFWKTLHLKGFSEHRNTNTKSVSPLNSYTKAFYVCLNFKLKKEIKYEALMTSNYNGGNERKEIFNPIIKNS